MMVTMSQVAFQQLVCPAFLQTNSPNNDKCEFSTCQVFKALEQIELELQK